MFETMAESRKFECSHLPTAESELSVACGRALAPHAIETRRTGATTTLCVVVGPGSNAIFYGFYMEGH